MELVTRQDDYAVRRYKQGFFQRAEFGGAWIDDGDSNGLSTGTLEAAASVAVPLGSFENLLIVTPSFAVDYVSAAPAGASVPPRLYATGVDLMWRKQLTDRWGTMIGVSPSVFSDFQTSDDAIRLTGRALATWQWFPEKLTLLLGVVYLDRNDIGVLPGAGLIWTPTPDWRLDVVFPRPKLAYRVAFSPRDYEHWLYFAGRLGGRTWGVEREPGVSDQLTLRDYRLAFGWERIRDGGGGASVEVGYVFGRELEYEKLAQSWSFGDALLLGGAVAY